MRERLRSRSHSVFCSRQVRGGSGRRSRRLHLRVGRGGLASHFDAAADRNPDHRVRPDRSGIFRVEIARGAELAAFVAVPARCGARACRSASASWNGQTLLICARQSARCSPSYSIYGLARPTLQLVKIDASTRLVHSVIRWTLTLPCGGPFCALTFAQPHPGTATILVDELDAGCLKCTLQPVHC